MTVTSRAKALRSLSRAAWIFILALALTIAAAPAYTAALPTIAAADDAPTITLSQVDDSEAVLITWTSVSNATGYRLERSKGWLGNDEQYINITDDQATQYTDTAVQYDNVYQYRVKAKKDGAGGSWSEQKHIQMSAPPGTPDTPTNVQSQENTPGDVTITWEHPEGGNDRTGYHVYRYNWSSGDGDIKIATKDAFETSHTDSTVSPETLYSYHLRAYNDIGNSLASQTTTITTKVQTPGVPDAPTSLTASEGTPRQVDLDWDAPEEGKPVTGYKVYRYRWTSGASDSCKTILLATLDANTTSYTDTSPEAEVFYEYQVRAYNDKGRSTISNIAYLTTQATQTAAQDDSGTEDTNNAPTGLPTIGGMPQVEQTLTADTSAINDRDGLTNVSYSHQWLAGGTDIDGATGSSYTLTATEEGDTIQVRVTFTDDEGNSESLTSVATDAVVAKPVPLTASFSNVPASHDGSAEFTFQVLFSEDVGISYVNMRDDAFTVTDGDVQTAKRVDGRHDLWEITVEPDDNSDVAITLPANRSCTTTGAICTGEDTPRQLSNTPSATVPGPSEESSSETTDDATEDTTDDTAEETTVTSQLSVADVTASEEDDSTIDFVVTLNPTGEANITVDYATANGTASAGTDYTAQSGTLTFTAGETSKTVTVAIIDDTTEENDETLTLTLSNASGAEISDGQATGTITDSEPVPLTASFSNVPDSHNGSTEFTLDLTFSENFPISYRTLRDRAFTEDDHGPVTKARRKVQGSNQTWTITVEPSGNGAITITLPATTDCAATGAICTDDGRKLSNSTTITVPGPQ